MYHQSRVHQPFRTAPLLTPPQMPQTVRWTTLKLIELMQKVLENTPVKTSLWCQDIGMLRTKK